MKKNRTTNTEQVLAQPTIYTFDLRTIPAEQYTESLDVLFQNPDFRTMVDARNRLVTSSNRLRSGSSEMANLIRTIQAKDHKIADIIFAKIVQANVNANMNYEFYSFKQLLRFFVDYTREGMQDKVTELSTNLDKITFLADALEGIMLDIKSEMHYIFGDEVEFHQFDTVSEVLKQLTGFFNSTRNGEKCEKDRDLYIEYADSINEYMAKRLKTYTAKYRKMHPLPKVYSKQDMIDALNQFFGTNKFFGDNFIAKTKSGGIYIDAMALANNLTPWQTEKLDSVVKEVPKNTTNDAMQKYSFAVTNAIMAHYIPNKQEDEIRH